MEEEIKNYFEKLNPNRLGIKGKIKVESVSKLGIGTGNANYLVKTKDKKFVFRLNMDPKNKNKSRKEFESLKLVEHLGISPKPLYIDETRKSFDSDLIILQYIEGIPSNKVKSYLSDKMIRNLGKLCGKMHSIEIKGKLKNLPISEISYKSYYNNIIKKIYLDYIKRHIRNKLFLEMINLTYKEIGKKMPIKNYNPKLVLSQGDFCEQNIIVKKGEYRLIDFEDLELTDPASQLAHIFIDFGKPFSKNQIELFLEEYLKVCKINKKDQLMKRVNDWIPLKRFAIFLWSVQHTLKIKNKEMHSHFLENDDFGKNVEYAKIVFNRALREGVIDKKYKNIDITKILKSG